MPAMIGQTRAWLCRTIVLCLALGLAIGPSPTAQAHLGDGHDPAIRVTADIPPLVDLVPRDPDEPVRVFDGYEYILELEYRHAGHGSYFIRTDPRVNVGSILGDPTIRLTGRGEYTRVDVAGRASSGTAASLAYAHAECSPRADLDVVVRLKHPGVAPWAAAGLGLAAGMASAAGVALAAATLVPEPTSLATGPASVIVTFAGAAATVGGWVVGDQEIAHGTFPVPENGDQRHTLTPTSDSFLSYPKQDGGSELPYIGRAEASPRIRVYGTTEPVEPAVEGECGPPPPQVSRTFDEYRGLVHEGFAALADTHGRLEQLSFMDGGSVSITPWGLAVRRDAAGLVAPTLARVVAGSIVDSIARDTAADEAVELFTAAQGLEARHPDVAIGAYRDALLAAVDALEEGRGEPSRRLPAQLALFPAALVAQPDQHTEVRGVLLGMSADDVETLAVSGEPAGMVAEAGMPSEEGLVAVEIGLEAVERGTHDLTVIATLVDGRRVQTPLRVVVDGVWSRARQIDAVCRTEWRDPGFDDVAAHSPHAPAVRCMAEWGVTAGTGPSTYGPGEPTRRDQMASFLTRLVTAAGGELPEDAPDAFADDTGNVHEPAINQLVALGIVRGTGADDYSPRQLVTRGQMASFLARTHAYLAGAPLPTAVGYFADTARSVHHEAINAIASIGVGAGTTAGHYAPQLPTRRDQMATFLARLFDSLVAEHGRSSGPGPEEERPADADDGHTLTVDVDAGEADPSNIDIAVSPAEDVHSPGEVVRLDAPEQVEADGYVHYFGSWMVQPEVAHEPDGTTLWVTMDDDVTVTAFYESVPVESPGTFSLPAR